MRKRSSCQYCRKTLSSIGFHFICHVCGATYCYVHMSRHDGAHPRVPKVLLPA